MERTTKINEKEVKTSLIFYSAIIASLSSLIFGICLPSIGPMCEISKAYEKNSFGFIKISILLTSTEIEMISSMIPIGCLISTIGISLFKLSTKHKIILNNFFYVVGNLLIYSMNSFIIILFGRLIIGFGMGITCKLIPSYLGEISPIKTRGIISAFHTLGIVIGLSIGAILVYFFNDLENYKNTFIFIIFFTGIHTFLLFFIMEPDRKSDCNEYNVSILTLLKEKRAAKSIIIATVLHLGQQLSCIYGIVFYPELILGSKDKIRFIYIFMAISGIIGTITSIFMVENFGRKPLIVMSSFICGISLCIIQFSEKKYIGSCMYMFGFNIGLGPVTWMITFEVFPVEFLKAGIIICNGINWFSAYIVSLTFPLLHRKLKNSCYYIYIFSMFGLSICMLIFFTETKGKKVTFQY